MEGGEAEGMQQMTLLNATADRDIFIVVYPEGTGEVTLGKLYGSWNTGKCCPPAFDNNVDDVGFISKIIDKLAIDFNIDKKRVYATGHSNGGLMSYKLRDGGSVPDYIKHGKTRWED
jgi:polyhydroxybutyrate depolymerase